VAVLLCNGSGWLWLLTVCNQVLLPFHRSSYPDHKDGEDVEGPGERPAERELDYDDDTMELILPSGRCRICVRTYFLCISHSCSPYLQRRSSQ